jgi:hypothetical protein
MLHTTTNRKLWLATMNDKDATRQALQNGLGQPTNVLGTMCIAGPCCAWETSATKNVGKCRTHTVGKLGMVPNRSYAGFECRL